MENVKYFYFDNWNGTKKNFRSLKKAKASAKKETGCSIAIISTIDNNIINVNASGFNPA